MVLAVKNITISLSCLYAARGFSKNNALNKILKNP